MKDELILLNNPIPHKPLSELCAAFVSLVVQKN